MPKTIVPASDLIDALRRVRPAAGGNLGLHGSSVVRLATTDEGLQARVRGYRGAAGSAYLSATATLDADGAPLPPTSVSFKTLSGMLGLVEDPKEKLVVEVTRPDEVALTLGRSKLTLRAWDDIAVADFSIWPGFETSDDTVGWDASALRDHMRFAAPSASRDDARPILTGVLVSDWGDGRTVVAATDSYRLAVSRFEGTPPPVALLLPSGIGRLLPDEDAHMTLHGGVGTEHRAISWASNGVEWVSQTISGEFPNYKGLIPSSQNAPARVLFDRDVAIRAVRRAQLLANLGGINTPIRFEIGYGETSGVMVKVVAQDVGTWEEFLPCDASGVATDLSVAFNPDYFLAGLRAMTQPVVELRCVDAQKPAVMETESRTYLLMPVRIS